MDIIDLDRHVCGEPTAPITVLEYGDFECPYCRSAAPVLKALVDGSAGQVRLVFRHFPLFTVHPFALTAALAAEAAGERFWAMHDLLFDHQDRLTDADLQEYGAAIGVRGVIGRAAQAFRPAIEADYQAGIAAAVRGTPTLLFGTGSANSERYPGEVELGALRTALGLAR
jgi:protein-disulfide isomerase